MPQQHEHAQGGESGGGEARTAGKHGEGAEVKLNSKPSDTVGV